MASCCFHQHSLWLINGSQISQFVMCCTKPCKRNRLPQLQPLSSLTTNCSSGACPRAVGLLLLCAHHLHDRRLRFAHDAAHPLATPAAESALDFTQRVWFSTLTKKRALWKKELTSLTPQEIYLPAQTASGCV